MKQFQILLWLSSYHKIVENFQIRGPYYPILHRKFYLMEYRIKFLLKISFILKLMQDSIFINLIVLLQLVFQHSYLRFSLNICKLQVINQLFVLINLKFVAPQKKLKRLTCPFQLKKDWHFHLKTLICFYQQQDFRLYLQKTQFR